MLEINLERALEPAQMQERPCGICGAGFEPDAVLANLVTPYEHLPVCEACLSSLARRAAEEAIPAKWDEVYAGYLAAVSRYPEPVFASVEDVMEAEKGDPHWREISKRMAV
jgi:hypothetical protein